jgi:peptidoglycan/LPS O-acetylase OafA/YrhL
MNRISALDGLRGILALVVVARHAGDGFGVRAFDLPAEIAVDIFFIMSSMVLVRSWRGNFPTFLTRRFVRLWPVYAVCITTAFLLRGQTPALHYYWLYPFDDIAGAGSPDQAAWSLAIEARAMLFMPAIVWCSRGPCWRMLAALAVWSGLCFVTPLFEAGGWFLLGACLSHWMPRSSILESRVPQFLGAISYSFYLSHMLVLGIGLRLGGKLGVVIAVPVAFYVGWLLWKLVELPSVTLSRRIHLSGRPKGVAATTT